MGGKVKKLTISALGKTLLNVFEAATKFLGMNLGVAQTPKEKATCVGSAIVGVMETLDKFALQDEEKK